MGEWLNRRLIVTASVAVSCSVLGVAMDAVGETATDPASEARRILARGHDLPPGFTSLVLDRKTVVVRMTPRGTSRERRRPSLAGAFELNGDAITFETIRGPRTNRRWQDDEVSRYELDVCFKDSAGRPFLLQMGGDEVLDPSCDPELQDEPLDDETLGGQEASGQDLNFRVAKVALQALQGVEFKRRFADEYAALVGHMDLITRAQEILTPDCAAANVVCEEDAAGTTRDLGVRNHNNRWRHIIDVYAGPIRRLPGTTHGATVTFRQDPRNSRISYAWHRCNHGRCFYGRNMSFRCAFWSAFNRRHHVHREACATWYSPRSGADWWWPGHNSNDDTSIQYRAVRTDRHYPSGWGSGWPCDDRQTHNNTSSCF